MKRLFFILLLFLAFVAGAQEIPAGTEQQLENSPEEAVDDDAYFQQLVFYQKHPLNLNSVGAEDLYPLRILTALQVELLLRYRAAFGKFLSVYELQAVPGLDLLTIRKLLPYVYAGEPQTVKDAFLARFRGGSHTVLLRVRRVLERSRGYDRDLPVHYLGDPNSVLLRYTYQYKNTLYWGLTGEKDAGERFFRGAQKGGFDFYSLHLFARGLGKIKALAVGDYTLNIGQGLVQWQSLAFGKSAEITAVKRQAPVLQPYRAAGEFYFNRGAAATLQLGRWQATAFLSAKKFSGHLVSDSAGTPFSSFGLSGYYRTPQEVQNRYNLSDLSAGGVLSYLQGPAKLSLNAVWHRFSHPLQKSAAPYNRFAPSGSSLFLGSTDYSFTHKNAHFFGELAFDDRFHHAFVQGLLVSVDPTVDLSLLYRHIQPAYQAPFANAFTENTLPTNETGLYGGLQMRPAAGLQLSAYADVYRFPFVKYRVSAPSRGQDYLLQLYYTPSKATEFYLRYRAETKAVNDTAGALHSPEDQQKQGIRFQVRKKFSRNFSLTWRTEGVWFSFRGQEETGFLSFLEAGGMGSAKLKGNARMEYFRTAGYNSRIYAYESDVLYSFSIPPVFGKGIRYYINLNFALSPRLMLWLRFSQTRYFAGQQIGTGLDAIDSNHRSELKLQFRYQF